MSENWEYCEAYLSFEKEALNIKLHMPEGAPEYQRGESVIEVLNELGKNGWEMVGVIDKPGRPEEGVFHQIFYFKRPARKTSGPSYAPLRGTR